MGPKAAIIIWAEFINYFATVRDVNADVILTASKELSKHFSVNASVGSGIFVPGEKFAIA